MISEKIVSILIEMFEQRNYTDIKRHKKHIIAKKPDDTLIYALLTIIPKLDTAVLTEKLGKLQNKDISHGLYIYQDQPTPAVNNVLSKIQYIDLTIELFPMINLQYNITKHYLVPKHELLSQEEIKKFKETYGTSIPIMLKSDPISVFYNYSKGDIIKVTRRNGYVSYRIVK
jgi:DNA-directed RNA polymerase I, II, and III subunit RPABC1